MTVPEEPDLRARRWAIVVEHIRCEVHGTDIDGAVAAFDQGHATYDVVPLDFLKPAGQDLTHPTSADVHAHLTYLTTVAASSRHRASTPGESAWARSRTRPQKEE